MNEDIQSYDALIQRLTSAIWPPESRHHYYRAQGQTIQKLMSDYWTAHPEQLGANDEPISGH